MAQRIAKLTPGLTYEVQILRDRRWHVVETSDSRQDSLDLAHDYRGRKGVLAIRVAAERFDPERGAFNASFIYFWRAGANQPEPRLPMFHERFLTTDHDDEDEPAGGWLWRLKAWIARQGFTNP